MKRNWEYKKLGDVASFRRGLTYAKDDVVNHSSKIVLRSNNINLETSSLNFDDVVCLRDDFVIPLDKLLRGGDIFICMSNGSTQHLGKVAHVQENLNMAFGGFMGVIEPNENLTNSRYVFYCCRSGAYRSYLNSIFNGANINNLKWSDLSKFVVPVPPLEEQSRIVAELDLLTGIIDKQNAQLKELDSLAQSIFYDMFGDPIENPKGWEVKKLESLGDLGRGVSKHRPRNAPELLGGTMPLIQTGDVANANYLIRDYNSTYSDLGVAQSKVWPKGTLCITIAATIGKCAILDFEACFPDSVVGFTPNISVDRTYIYFIFCNMQKMLEDFAPGVAQKNINLAILNSLLIPVPPLALQQSFAEKIQSIEKQKETIRASIADTQKLLDYTMDKYFG